MCNEGIFQRLISPRNILPSKKSPIYLSRKCHCSSEAEYLASVVKEDEEEGARAGRRPPVWLWLKHIIVSIFPRDVMTCHLDKGLLLRLMAAGPGHSRTQEADHHISWIWGNRGGCWGNRLVTYSWQDALQGTICVTHSVTNNEDVYLRFPSDEEEELTRHLL